MRKITLNKILLVDDDPVSVYVSERSIQKIVQCSRITILKNGQEALEFILQVCKPEESKICPELIFLDNHMPVITGMELMERLKAENFTNWDQVLVVVISASLTERDRKQFEELGVSEFIDKPLTTEKIDNIITRYFGSINDIEDCV